LYTGSMFDQGMSEEKLAVFLQKGKDWEKVKTTAPGVFVMRIPGTKNRKRRGLIIRSAEEYLEFKDILMNEKLESLLEMLEDVNPETARPGKTTKDVIEI
jgi:hypothetical protein